MTDKISGTMIVALTFGLSDVAMLAGDATILGQLKQHLGSFLPKDVPLKLILKIIAIKILLSFRHKEIRTDWAKLSKPDVTQKEAKEILERFQEKTKTSNLVYKFYSGAFKERLTEIIKKRIEKDAAEDKLKKFDSELVNAIASAKVAAIGYVVSNISVVQIVAIVVASNAYKNHKERKAARIGKESGHRENSLFYIDPEEEKEQLARIAVPQY